MDVRSVNSFRNQVQTPVRKTDEKLRRACEDFEAVFVHQLLRSMRNTVLKSNLMGSRREEELFQDMMDSEVSKAAAKTRSMGIADLLYRQLGPKQP